MLNPYFTFRTAPNEQSLLEGLIIEAIQIYGIDIIYIPKIFVDYDALRGEDPMRAFRRPYTVEAYFENAEGWMGDKNILNQMGLGIEKQAKFVIAKKRFDQVLYPNVNWQGTWDTTVTYGATDGVTYNGQLYASASAGNVGHQPSTSSASWTAVAQVRPMEGDIIYLPLTHDIFEINFADHEEVFYQLGKIYAWKITCEKFQFSHEEFTTGISEIDSIVAQITNNDSVDNDPLADNTAITTKIQDFLELDANSPF